MKAYLQGKLFKYKDMVVDIEGQFKTIGGTYSMEVTNIQYC